MIRLINRLLLSISEEDIYKNFAASCDCLLGINIILCALLSNTIYGGFFYLTDQISYSHERVKLS
jgi:hypothetical protein